MTESDSNTLILIAISSPSAFFEYDFVPCLELFKLPNTYLYMELESLIGVQPVQYHEVVLVCSLATTVLAREHSMGYSGPTDLWLAIPSVDNSLFTLTTTRYFKYIYINVPLASCASPALRHLAICLAH